MSQLALIVLVAGCGAHREQAPRTSTSTSTTTSQAAPGPQASVESVTRWIEAGDPVDAEKYRTIDQGGTPGRLAEGDVAFRAPRELGPRVVGGCITQVKYQDPLSCPPGLRNAQPRPPGLPGQWIGGWVSFDGATVTVGSLHGDPGPFIQGVGLPLEYGKRLKFGDYQCRSDRMGLYCVNYPHRSAIRMSEELEVYGCAQRATPPHGIGMQYDCG